jgi:hypothetical protein
LRTAVLKLARLPRERFVLAKVDHFFGWLHPTLHPTTTEELLQSSMPIDISGCYVNTTYRIYNATTGEECPRQSVYPNTNRASYVYIDYFNIDQYQVRLKNGDSRPLYIRRPETETFSGVASSNDASTVEDGFTYSLNKLMGFTPNVDFYKNHNIYRYMLARNVYRIDCPTATAIAKLIEINRAFIDTNNIRVFSEADIYKQLPVPIE